MDCSTPGFPVLHYLPEFVQTHVHWVWCHPTISFSATHFSSCLQSSPASGSFPMSQLFTLGGQSIGAPASVLPMNIQDWFLLVCIDWFALLAIWHSGKDKTMETVKKISGCQRKGMNKQSTENCSDSETILHGATLVDSCHNTRVKQQEGILL